MNQYKREKKKMTTIMAADNLRLTAEGRDYKVKYRFTDATGGYIEYKYNNKKKDMNITRLRILGDVSMVTNGAEVVFYANEDANVDDVDFMAMIEEYDGVMVFFVRHEWDLYISSSEEAIRDAIEASCSAECAGR